MDLILINDNKLKVVLTPEDMTAYALTADTIDYDNTETKRAFWDILDTAKHRTGFDAASDRVFIQVYPSRGGGCELYVTKLHGGREKSVLPRDRVCGVERKTAPETATFVFGFDALPALLSACRALRGKNVTRSAAYIDEETKQYYLITESVREPSLSEFGRLQPAAVQTYLAEHGRCLCAQNAVEVLASLA